MAERVGLVEERLERLLASGWLTSRSEAAHLVPEADALERCGLGELARLLRGVTTAETELQVLRSVALAWAACRLVRARVPSAALPEGKWVPLTRTASRRRPASDSLLPLGRVSLETGEAWACLRVEGARASGWVLVDPPAAASKPDHARTDLSVANGHAAMAGPLWLRQEIRGQLCWRAPYPLGAGGEVQQCSLEEVSWPGLEDAGADPLAPFRRALAGGKLKDDGPVLPGEGRLRVRQLERDRIVDYVWPDPAVSRSFGAIARGTVWGLVWVERDLVAPLALLNPGGLLRRARLIHLVPGGAADTLAG